MKTFILEKSDKNTKKYKITFINPETNRKKSIHFGAKGYDDYITSKDDKKRDRYLQRHSTREDWNDLSSAGAWSRWILWQKKTLPSAIKHMEKMFDITIHNKAL